MAAEDFAEPNSEEVKDHGEIGRDDCDECFTGAPFIGELCAIFRILWKTTNEVRQIPSSGGTAHILELTTRRKTLLIVAQTRTKTPELRTIVAAIFFKGFRLDCQSIGIGMNMRYGSVMRFEAKVTAMTGVEMAGWHTSRGIVSRC